MQVKIDTASCYKSTGCQKDLGVRKEKGVSDLISRQAVLDFPIRLDHYDEENGNLHFVLGIESVMEYVESLPSAEKTGKWIECGANSDGTHNIKCNQCEEGYKSKGHAKSIYTRAKYRFCPNCGSKNGR